MLDDAVAAFLETVSERALDEPLLALLRAQGFEQVQPTHGPTEFGKDIVAQKGGEQWAFQSKAGNIGQSAWREITGQLDELRLSNYAGPGFDPSLPRQPVLVTTGRLTGNAPLLATEYKKRAQERGEPGLDVWGKDELLARLSGHANAVLRGSIDGALLSILGAVERDDASMDAVELFARRWDAFPTDYLLGLGIIEAALVCERLKQRERLDLACHAALSLVRAAWAGTHDAPSARVAADAGGALFEAYARDLWTDCGERLLRRRGLVAVSDYAAWATYPIRCLRIAELLGLLALRAQQEDDPFADEVADWLSQFISRQPGTTHPMGERFAVSFIPPVLLLSRRRPGVARMLLTQTAVWLCDRNDNGNLGLGDTGAVPEEEIARVFGSAFEHVKLRPQKISHLASIALDLAALCRFRRLYGDIRNDLLAVDVVPRVLRCPDSADQYKITGEGNRWELNPTYPDEIPRTGALGPAHHTEAERSRHLMRQGRPWDLLAVSSALRDRHFVAAMAQFI
ncbi:MAG TPA: restriction endonuclease [Conexibacter sp.]|nr:restriction endonuclease [Conexibacter sp.]